MLLTIISAVIALGVLIVFHEFGHFLIAKCSGIRVQEFSIGLGPKVIGTRKGETIYKLSAIPFGGYVKLAGMEPKEVSGERYEFASKPAVIKTGTVAAGPVFNFMLALLLFTVVAFIFGIPTLPTRVVQSAGENTPLKPRDEIIAINGEEVHTWDDITGRLACVDSAECVIRRDGGLHKVMLGKDSELEPLVLPIIGKVARDGPAWKSGIREGDLVTHVNGREINNWDTLVSIIQKSPEKEILLGWLRDGKYMEAKLVPRKEQMFIDGKIKEVGMIMVQIKSEKKRLGIKAFKESFLRSTGIMILTFSFFKKLIAREISPRSLGGPVAIVKFAGESAKWGLESFLIFVGFLSIQLFIFNLIPFPPLDGGQVLLIFIEKVKKSPISQRTISMIQNIGFAILILFIFYITVNDIARIIKPR